MSKFEILTGLPPYGPPALPFPASGERAFREGLVVRFHSEAGDLWIGNFQRGFFESFDFAIDHPDRRQVIVIAGGEGYFVDPQSRRQTHGFGGDISFAQYIEGLNLVLIAGRTEVAAFSADGQGWNSERLSWDGLRHLAVSGSILNGEAWSPVSSAWFPFALNLRNGVSCDAIYPREMATALQFRPAEPRTPSGAKPTSKARTIRPLRELTQHETNLIAHNLREVGSTKPIGYLPLDAVRRFLRAEPEDVARVAEDRGLSATILSKDECCIKSGALYVYDSAALSQLLARNAVLLGETELPAEPESFVRAIAAHWFERDKPIMSLIRAAFGET
jgi:hypothetical protein